MNSQVYFENIRERIIETLDQCEFDLKIAVAWFTDTKLLSKVEELSKRGVKVKIIIYDDHINQKQFFENLYYNGTEVFLSKKLMHNKFCVIDGKTVINGSYNWTHSASTNEENVQILLDNKEFADKFVLQFFKLKRNCNSINDFFDYSIDSLRLLEEEFEAYYQRKNKPEFPYFLNLKNINFSEVNESYSQIFKKGYYFIRGEKEEENFYWFMYFLNSVHPIKKLSRLVKKEKIALQIYQNIEGLEDENGVIKFNGEKHFIELVSCKIVFFIDKKGNEIGERIKYSYKFENGLYLIDNNDYPCLTNFDNKEKVLELQIAKVHNEFGIIGVKRNTKYGINNKIGLINLYGEELVEFKYDYYSLDENNCEIQFYEYPHLYYHKANGILLTVNKDYKKNKYNKWFPFKLTKYNYRKSKIQIEEKCVPKLSNYDECILFNKHEYLFLTDNNEDYRDLYLAVSNQFYEFDFTFMKQSVKTISDLNIYMPYNGLYKHLSRIDYLKKEEIKERNLDDYKRKHKIYEYAPKNEGCYIATMVYQDYNHPKVITLRVFRDNVLLKYHFGKWFVSKYYKYSPRFVEIFKDTICVKPIKVFVDIIVYVLEKASGRQPK